MLGNSAELSLACMLSLACNSCYFLFDASYAFLLLEHLVGGLTMRWETSMFYVAFQACE
jgi:hypothetical protein